ncbi:MAG: hypothetical protein GKS01_11915 [Alphaproteobacteria bacterium]|nr:hypothetical protein [Alphaproteobacteria bacterium]
MPKANPQDKAKPEFLASLLAAMFQDIRVATPIRILQSATYIKNSLDQVPPPYRYGLKICPLLANLVSLVMFGRPIQSLKDCHVPRLIATLQKTPILEGYCKLVRTLGLISLYDTTGTGRPS